MQLEVLKGRGARATYYTFKYTIMYIYRETKSTDTARFA
jgi:hypothetical protein